MGLFLDNKKFEIKRRIFLKVFFLGLFGLVIFFPSLGLAHEVCNLDSNEKRPPFQMEDYSSLSQVIVDLETVGNFWWQQKCGLAVFALTYARVTREFEQWIKLNRFQRPAFVQQMVLKFMHKYREAILNLGKDGKAPEAWKYAHLASIEKQKLSVQLLLGLNAHIAADLPLILEGTLSQEFLVQEEQDYFVMNELFRQLMPKIWEILKELNRAGPNSLEMSSAGEILSKAKLKIVYKMTKIYRLQAFNNGVLLWQTEDPNEKMQIRQRILNKATAQGKAWYLARDIIPREVPWE